MIHVSKSIRCVVVVVAAAIIGRICVRIGVRKRILTTPTLVCEVKPGERK